LLFSAEPQASSVLPRVSAMKKQQNEPAIVVEWNCDPVAGQAIGCDGLSEEGLLALARALGRLAARRDLEAARNERADTATTSDAVSGKILAKAQS
jgi:hypothetical protein